MWASALTCPPARAPRRAPAGSCGAARAARRRAAGRCPPASRPSAPTGTRRAAASSRWCAARSTRRRPARRPRRRRRGGAGRALDHADHRAGDVERARCVDARHLGRLAAEQGAPAASHASAIPVTTSATQVGVQHAGRHVVEEEQRACADCTSTSPTQWLTMSWPTDPTRPSRAASSTLVPTPSVDATSTGSSSAAMAWPRTPRRSSRRRARTSAAVRALDGGTHPVDGPGALVDVDAGGGVRRQRRSRCPPPDVPAHLHAVEPDAIDGVVGDGARFGQIAAEPGHSGDTTTRDDAAGEAGREEVRAGGQLTDRRPRRRSRCGGVPRCGCHDGARRTRIDPTSMDARSPSTHAIASVGEIRAQQRQDGLRLGVAEPAVVLEEAWTVGGEHQPGVEHADVRRAGRRAGGRAPAG